MLDYEETFSPVAKMVTVRTIFSLAAFKNAFLYGELDREVFAEQQKGYVSNEYPHHVCFLKKALYGLKQVPRARLVMVKLLNTLFFMASSFLLQILVCSLNGSQICIC